MALDDLDGIANVQFTISMDLTWEGASDWDAAVDERGVVHESFGDLPGDDVIQMGYPSFDQGGSALRHFYVWDGTGDVTDIVGSNDLTNHGASSGQTGIAGTDTYRYDGDNDYSQGGTPNLDGNELTFFAWLYIHGRGGNSYNRYFDIDRSTDNALLWWDEDDDEYGFNSTLGKATVTGSEARTGVWMSWAGVFDGSTLYFYEDGVEQDTTSVSGSLDFSSSVTVVAQKRNADASDWGNIRPDYWRMYNRGLSGTEIQDLHDGLADEAHLETATKSLSSPAQPDITDLTYSLNGQSITLDVIGSPGTASEEVVSQVLDGAASYTLTWSDDHTDFRVKPRLSTNNVTQTPTFTSVTIS